MAARDEARGPAIHHRDYSTGAHWRQMMPGVRTILAIGDGVIAKPEAACLVIADISGYTGYLAGVELDHAQDILADLTDTIVGALRPTFRLAKLEGDAVFAYVVADAVDGSLLQDAIERTYSAFRRRLRDIEHASRCECNACTLIPRLDLKFVVHHGSLIRQRIAGREELLGSDVILVHRLLKNAVIEALGFAAYALYTQPCIAAMGIEDPVAQGLVEHRETIDVIGEVRCWVRDLDHVWRTEQERARVRVEPRDAHHVIAWETPAPPQLVWEYLTSPIRRPQWGAGIDEVREQAPGGRRGTGTTNHCVHGKDAIIEEILDWQPFDSWTTRSTMPMPGLPKLVMTDVLEPTADGGTRVEVRVARPKPRERAAFDQVFPMVEGMLMESGDTLRVVLAEEVARRAAVAADVDEPAVPQSARRWAVEPVGATGPVDSIVSRSSSG